MSNVNISRAIENIKSGTSVYTPLVEIIVNGIQAIDEISKAKGIIHIIVNRSYQTELNDSTSEIHGFTVIDNGIGFTEKNRASFDTLYSDYKIKIGGKGFGRFICLKYFDDLSIESIYKNEGVHKKRTFLMGKENDIIMNESIEPTNKKQCGSIVKLISIKSSFPNKKLTTMSRILVEKLLPYFVTENYQCPEIQLREDDKSEPIILNDYLSTSDTSLIKEIKVKNSEFHLGSTTGEQLFKIRIFKFYSPRNQKSKISLVANKREVTSTSIHNYIPEFIEEFYDKTQQGEDIKDHNFIIKVYVFSTYLDNNVSLERGDFEFQKDNDLIHGISQTDIEAETAKFAAQIVDSDVNDRREKTSMLVNEYVDEKAPWHRQIAKKIDLSDLPFKPTEEQIENKLQKDKYNEEVIVRRDVKTLLDSDDTSDLKENAADIVRRVSETSKNDLIHYIALRRNVLDIFEKSLEMDADGKYSSEAIVHDIIFPRKGDSNETSFDEHNLWIVDERLNFSDYVSSDKALDKDNADFPDLLAYNRNIMFRGDNEPSNPVTIFELKKPQREGFVNPSEKEDPIQQLIRYVNKIRDGKFKTPKGKEIRVTENTTFYGFIVCTLTTKVKKWLEDEKNFAQMPDAQGYFIWQGNINLYIEVLDWDKVLKDSIMRNKIFFHKLGI